MLLILAFLLLPISVGLKKISIHFCTKQLHIFFQQICQMGQTFNGSRFSYARILNLF